jgi:hypothetical protein
LKANQREIGEAVRLWLWGHGVLERPPDFREWSRGHGRVEEREIWFLESSELGEYLEREYGWPGLKFCGVIRRRRCKGTRVKDQGAWEEQEFLWVAGGAVQDLNPKKALRALRRHWEIENRLFWVRDVDFSEDRLHGRRIGPGLSVIRSVAINLIRALGYRFVVDGFRALSARADRGLILLIGPQP